MTVVGLERALHQYTLEPSETPFDLKSVPLATQPLVEQKGKTVCLNITHSESVCLSVSFVKETLLIAVPIPKGLIKVLIIIIFLTQVKLSIFIDYS